MTKKTGVLLVNLGTPESPDPKDVKRYLTEFLTDPRVIDTSAIVRQLLVRGVIIPRRYKASAASYKEVWTPQGSPLMVYGRSVAQKLQHEMGDEVVIELAMRYQNPSIRAAIQKLLQNNIDHLIVLPLFPQYASATTGSVHQKVMDEIRNEWILPQMTFIDSYYDHPKMLDTFVAQAQAFDIEDYDHILFSFHGLPERQLRKADRSGSCCLKRENCCQVMDDANKTCYSAQCHATAYGIIERLGLKKDRYSICYQSRLGSEPWLQPYAAEVIEQLAKKGCKKILCFCPAFVADCLETLYEFSVENKEEFQKYGGESLDLVPSLNDHPMWIEALKEIIAQNLKGVQAKESSEPASARAEEGCRVRSEYANFEAG